MKSTTVFSPIFASTAIKRRAPTTGLIFTGGIGENSASIRQNILQNLPQFGIKANLEKNAELSRGVEGSFHQADSLLQLWVIPTDEEYQIAKETKEVLGL